MFFPWTPKNNLCGRVVASFLEEGVLAGTKSAVKHEGGLRIGAVKPGSQA